MTKTIQQMADSIFNKDTYECDCTKMLIDMLKDSFINGGYTVLEEIESEVFSSEIGESMLAEDMLGILRDTIKQLKGE